MNRIERICDLVGEHSICCDIGTDHGKVPILLKNSGKAKRIIATDISSDSLSKLENFIGTHTGFSDDIETRVGDGFEPIRPFEADTAIVTGLGGALIGEMIEEDRATADSFDRMILQANNGRKGLRRLLHRNGFKIIDEVHFYDKGKYYVLLHTAKEKERYDKDYEYEFGKIPIDDGDPALIRYLTEERARGRDILREIRGIDTASANRRREELNRKDDVIRTVLERMEADREIK